MKVPFKVSLASLHVRDLTASRPCFCQSQRFLLQGSVSSGSTTSLSRSKPVLMTGKGGKADSNSISRQDYDSVWLSNVLIYDYIYQIMFLFAWPFIGTRV